jgi:phosphoribosylformylglycinamidine synthase
VVSADAEATAALAAEAGVPLTPIGVTGGDALTLAGDYVTVAALSAAHEDWLPAFMAGGN